MKTIKTKLKGLIAVAAAFSLIAIFNTSAEAQVINGYEPFKENKSFSNDTLNSTDVEDLSFRKGQFESGWYFAPENTTSTNYVTVQTNSTGFIDQLNVFTRNSTAGIKIYTEKFFFISGVSQPFSFTARQNNNSGGDIDIEFRIVDEDHNAPIGLTNNLIFSGKLTNAANDEVGFEYGGTSPITGVYRIEITFKQASSPNRNHIVGFGNFATDYSLLPVEYAAFEAKQLMEGIKLSWTTAMELNNSHFNVEHSIDGENWMAIGVVDGNGTTYEQIEYEYIHNQPVRGANFYRLIQEDFDGTQAPSKTMMVYVSESELAPNIRLYPNPSVGTLHIEGTSNPKVTVFNTAGVSLLVSENQNILDLSHLKTGVYFVQVEDASGIISKHRFIKE